MLEIFFSLFTQTIEYTKATPVHAQEIVREVEPAPPVAVEKKKEKPKKECLQCVSYLRRYYPNLPRQDAKDFVPNSSMRDADLIILRYGEVYHIAKILSLESKGILVEDANFIPCEVSQHIVKYKTLKINLIGFFSLNAMEEEKKDEALEETSEEEETSQDTPEEEKEEVTE